MAENLSSTLEKPDSSKEIEYFSSQFGSNGRYLNVVERYYKRTYCVDVQGKVGEDHCILIHSNRVCIITVAKSHPLISQNKVVKSVDFQISKDLNRTDNKVIGKNKRGAQWLGAMSALCKVKCEDGSMYTLYSCIRGQLIEVNENLLSSPQLIVQKPQTNGYIAIVIPRLREHAHEVNKLLTEEDYQGFTPSFVRITIPGESSFAMDSVQ